MNKLYLDGIAVDWISDKLYYQDQCHDLIGVLDLTTNLHTTLANQDTVNDYYHYYANIVVDTTTRLAIDKSVHGS